MAQEGSGFINVRLIFKDCELGTADTVPVFRIQPEKISAAENGVCRIDSARRVTAVFGLKTLEQGFAVLLDKAGHLQGDFPELFARPGKLRLVPENDPQKISRVFPAARLAGNTGYGILPEAGHRLLLEFELFPAGPDGAYMVQETFF